MLYGGWNRRNFLQYTQVCRATATKALSGIYPDFAGMIAVYRRFSATAEFHALM